jgi:hypothetical protein
LTLERIRVAISIEVDVVNDEQKRRVVKKFADAVMPALAAVFRRTDTPTLSVDSVA